MGFRIQEVWIDGNGIQHEIKDMPESYIKNCIELIKSTKLSVNSNIGDKEDDDKETLKSWWMKHKADDYLKTLQAELDIRGKIAKGQLPRMTVVPKCCDCVNYTFCDYDLDNPCDKWKLKPIRTQILLQDYVSQEVAKREGYICNGVTYTYE